MAVRTWGKALLGAFGLSMLAGAGQLGMAYGFGIVRITGDFTDATVNRWPAQLVWVGWFAASAAVAGAVVTARLARAAAVATTTGRLRLAAAAALGATVVAPLCMQPARSTQLNGVDPVWAVGICAILGAVVGAGAALAVLLRPPLGWNVTMVVGVVWLIALVSSLPALVGTGPLPTVRLGVFEPGWLGADPAQRLAPLLLPLLALLLGAAAGALARRRHHSPLIGGVSGAAGPVLVAFAYLAAGPGGSADRYQLAPYYGALIAVVTGALGSTTAALLRWPLLAQGGAAERREATPEVPGQSTGEPGPSTGVPGQSTGEPAIEPTDILRPLATAPSTPAARTTGGGDPAGLEAGTARRVPSTVGDPLLPDSAGITRDRNTPATPAGDGRPEGNLTGLGSSPAGAAGSPATGTPAHWEWPTATAPIGEETGATGETAPTALAGTPRPSTSAAPAAPHPVAADAPPMPTAVDEPAPVRPASPALAADAAAGPVSPTAATPGPASPTAAAPDDADATGLVTAPRPKRARKPKGSTAATTRQPDAPTEAADIGDPTAGPDAATDTAGARAADSESGTRSSSARAGGTRGSGRRASSARADDAAPDSGRAGGAEADSGRAGGAEADSAAATGTRDEATGTRDSATGTPDNMTGTPDNADGTPDSATGTRDNADGGTPTTGGAAGGRTGREIPAAEAGPAAGGPPGSPTAGAAGSDTPAALHPPRRRPRPVFFFDPPSVDDVAPPGPPQPAWTVDSDPDWSPPPAEDGPAPVDPAPRPRPRLPLPDLDRAANWDAFGTAPRRTRPPAADRTVAAAQGTPPAPESRPDASEPRPHRPEQPEPTGYGQVAVGSSGGGTAGDGSGGHRPATGEPTDHATADGGASGDGTATESPTDAADEPAGARSRLRRGLFRRNRTRGADDADPTSERDDHREQESLPPQDEEYVDWVTGLARPVPGQDGGSDGTGERSLRPSGRHHRD